MNVLMYLEPWTWKVKYGAGDFLRLLAASADRTRETQRF